VGSVAGMIRAFYEWLLLYKKKINIIILCFLLFVRLADAYMPRIWGDYAFFYYVLISFPVLVYIIWFNRENLSELNIDRSFILIFVFCGALVTLLFWSSYLGIIAGIGTLIVFLLLSIQRLRFNDTSNLSSIIVITLLGLAPIILLRTLDNRFYSFDWLSVKQESIYLIIVSRLWSVVYEEMLFRGMLWMMLKNLTNSNWKVLFIQGFIFWIAHFSYLPRLSFWISVPLSGLWFGLLLWRSKSLTPGTIVHFIYNLSIAIFMMS
jgi:membrane protease YdiL (CAAX protease family)